MTCMYSFCFSFSVRLGTILVGAICLLQAVIGVIISSVGMSDPKIVSMRAQSLLDNYEFLFLTDMLENIVADPTSYLTPVFASLITYSVASIVLVYGAFKCNLYLVYPFIVLDFARLVFLCVYFVFAMMIIKENILNLGLIIGYSVVGGFVLLFMFYMWFCIVSFCQIVKELERQDDSKTPLDEYSSVPQKPLAYVGLGDHPYFHYPITLGRPIY